MQWLLKSPWKHVTGERENICYKNQLFHAANGLNARCTDHPASNKAIGDDVKVIYPNKEWYFGLDGKPYALHRKDCPFCFKEFLQAAGLES